MGTEQNHSLRNLTHHEGVHFAFVSAGRIGCDIML